MGSFHKETMAQKARSTPMQMSKKAYRAKKFMWVLYDIGLARLQEPVPSSVAQPISFSTVPLESFVGKDVRCVACGTTSALSPGLGVGIKRGVLLPIDRVDLLTYSNTYQNGVPASLTGVWLAMAFAAMFLAPTPGAINRGRARIFAVMLI
jgi:hypothetical protein